MNAGGSSVRLGVHSIVDREEYQLGKYDADLLPAEIYSLLLSFVSELGLTRVYGVCHRVVHAGPHYSQCQFIDHDLEQAISDHMALAPLHNKQVLDWIVATRKAFGVKVPQLAVFDSGFFADLPDRAACYALPNSIGIRKLGFHGLAHQAMLRYAEEQDVQSFPTTRALSLHLGSGCSITASLGGKALDTSMGFTPLEGLMMNTRSGDIDPGIILHLFRQNQLTVEDLDNLLNRRSGLLGVSGSSADIGELLTHSDAQSELAVDMFCYRIRKYIGAYAVMLGGLDRILIGGGIGEYLPAVRARILSDLELLGVGMDIRRNNDRVGTSGRISADESQVKIDVVQVDENTLMAEQAIGVLQS